VWQLRKTGIVLCAVGAVALLAGVTGGGGWGPCGPVHVWALFALLVGVVAFFIGGLITISAIVLRLLRKASHSEEDTSLKQS